ncbi:MAG: 5-(carboxyamino)imidazole ribonucleotide synthase [Synechococcales cyanobacterium RU_4_20]|nr:5-(carboxyamino)imidazole ribonucleotide synthase [Synechococcales cyanobacterium RU_4_20]
MMAAAVQKLGLELRVQTPSLADPAVAIAHQVCLGPIQDLATTRALTAHSDVITFENEFVNLADLAQLEAEGVVFAPSLRSLAPLLDKAHQRTYLRQLGLPTPDFLTLADIPAADRRTWKNPLGFPVVLKARRLGYDGQGTSVIQTAVELRAVLDTEGFEPFLLEKFVPFDRELAVMAARNSAGEIAVYPVVETQQERQICRWVLAPAELSTELQQGVATIATRLLEALEWIGIFGLELFESGGEILINEIAPRTHNSGHYTLDACETSQFEQQLRAVTGRSLGNPQLKVPGAVMVNLLGFESADLADLEDEKGQSSPRSMTGFNYVETQKKLAQIPQAHLYWYGKKVSRPGRKLGHVTVTLRSEDSQERRQEAMAAIAAIDAIWPPLA